MPDPDFYQHAACRDYPQEWWFSGGEEGQQAITICMRCPVRQECLDHAVIEREEWGLWGGVRESERRQIRRAEAKARRDARRAAG